MPVATINLTFDDDLVEQIDLVANNEALTRADLIYNSVKMYVNRKQKMQEYECGVQAAAADNSFLKRTMDTQQAFEKVDAEIDGQW